MTRIAIPDFQLANALYAGATVSFYTVSDGAKTSTLQTLYAGLTGSDTLSNPVTLDSEGKFQQIPYIDAAAIATVSGLSISDHDTGIIHTLGSWRGDWATATVYYPGDLIRDGANGDDTKDIYRVESTHTSGTWATDAADSTKLALVIDISVVIALLDIPDVSGGSALDLLRVNSLGTAYEFRSPTETADDIDALTGANNLSDLDDANEARTNLGLAGTQHGHPVTAPADVPIDRAPLARSHIRNAARLSLYNSSN